MIRASLLLAFLLPATADEVVLADGSRLSGTVTALSDSGQVTLDSPLAFEPFQLLAGRIERAAFSHQTSLSDEHDALVVLSNGDRFPADLTMIDADTVGVNTTFAGPILIPRDNVSTVQLGVRPTRVIYRGPESDSGWAITTGWGYDSRRFAASRSGTIARSFDIPGSFSLSFRLAWRTSPNIQIYFAADSFETSGRTDRYYLQFGGSGFELKRQQSQGQAYLSMAIIPRDPAEFTSSSVEVELRVDRKLGIVQVFLDGEYEGKFADPAKTVPTGQGIMFRSNIGGEAAQYIDRIEIREWNASSDRHRREERGDTSKDVLITRTSDRGTGRILELVPDEGGGSIRFKGPHHPEPVDHPLSNVSTLFFANPEGDEGHSPPLTLGLRSRGSLGVESCTLSGDSISARHPLLGELQIRRESVASLERQGIPAEDEDHPEEP